jgi:hypothetical protein
MLMSIRELDIVAKLAARFGIDAAAARRVAEEVVVEEEVAPPTAHLCTLDVGRLAPTDAASRPEEPLQAVLNQVGSVVASFLDVRGLCRLAMSGIAFRAVAEAELEQRLNTPLGRTLLARHALEFSASRLAFCVEICPASGQYMKVSMSGRTKGHLTEGDVWELREGHGEGWGRVLFVMDGYVVWEAVEAHYKYTRFGTVRLSLPHLLDVLEPDCIQAWELREPLKYESMMRECWLDGWEMYLDRYGLDQ